MDFIIDTHLHLYPTYKLELAFESLLQHLITYQPDAVKCGILTETSGHHYFKNLKEDKIILNGNIQIKKKWDDAIKLGDHKHGFYLFPGRQIISKENIEILCLLADANIADGLAAQETLEAILGIGGVPVVSWAPGKWFYSRGHHIKKLLDTNEPGSFLLGDTSLRPNIWPKPRLMKYGESLGYKTIFGSDPLPPGEEEMLLGQYNTVMDAAFDNNNPASSIKSALMNPGISAEFAGRRYNTSITFSRLYNHFKHKRYEKRIS